MSISKKINKILVDYGFSEFINWEKIDGGKINFSAKVYADGNQYLLQALSPIFTEDLMDDTDVILGHLAKKSIPVPKIIRPDNGWIKTNGQLWRLMEWLEHDESPFITDNNLIQCAEFLAKFHLALEDLDYKPKYKIPHFHETKYFLEQLNDLSCHPESEDITDQIGIHNIRTILDAGQKLMFFDTLPQQIIHGDPKLGNYLIKNGRVLTLIDYDTFMLGSVLIDLCDMLRSLCKYGTNRTEFDFIAFDLLSDAYCRYNNKDYLTPKKILQGTALIALELATRYAVDCYSEPGKEYFFHKKDLYDTGLEQNLASFRAEYQYFQNIYKLLK